MQHSKMERLSRASVTYFLLLLMRFHLFMFLKLSLTIYLLKCCNFLNMSIINIGLRETKTSGWLTSALKPEHSTLIILWAEYSGYFT